MNKRDNKGITLIALVITIVVLLILAGISLSALIGDNGIIKKARQAKNDTLESQNIENTAIKIYGDKIDEIMNEIKDEDSKNIKEAAKEWLNKVNEDYYNYGSLSNILKEESLCGKLMNSSSATTYLCNNKELLTIVLESAVARNALYENYEVTESILANSSIAIECMKESSKYEVVKALMEGTGFKNLYNSRAFVLGVSQGWHNGSLAVTMTHGNYINGSATYTYPGGGSGNTRSGLGIIVNKFAYKVEQKQSYSGVAVNQDQVFCAAIFKID